MIDYSRSALELELEAKTAAFIRDQVIPYEHDPRILEHGPSDELRIELQAKAKSAGLLVPHLPQAYGGQGLNHRQTATVFRAAGYSLLGPVAMNIMAPDEGNMYLLDQVGTPEQKAHFLRPLAAGETRSAFFMTEPQGGAGSDPSLLATTARRDGNHWVISGRKWLITGAEGAGVGIVMAKTETAATLFLIDLPHPGVVIERVLQTIDRTMPGGHAVVRFDDVRVDADQILGEVEGGFTAAQIRLAPARLTHCMRWWGAASRAHAIATDYAYHRQGFGKPLIDHEGVGFMLADNDIDLHQALLTIDHAAWVLDQHGPLKADTAVSGRAKVAVSEALFKVADRCVQVMGGAGVTGDSPVQQIFRDIRAFRIYDGPTEVHKWSIAKRIKAGVRDRKPA